ncbi:MAG: PstS family phosphate ABC transporter substrate-binding protein [Bdellovibrionota bacterium]
MKSTTRHLITLSLGLCLSLSALARTTVKVDGSSTVFPITEAVAEEFQKEQQGKTLVTVGISGTGGGFKKFCRGETDVQDASRPIKTEEAVICKDAGIGYIELPIAYDAITLVVSKKNTWLKDITVAELATLWAPAAQGKVTTWDQVRKGWPKKAIHLYGAGSDSGTFDYFTEVVNGKAKASRSDYTSSEDDNTLVQGVSQDDSGFGYIPFSYFENNVDKLTNVAVKNVKGQLLLPTAKTIADGSYAPFSRPIFIYVSTKALEKAEVGAFVDYYLKNTVKLVTQVGYVALPENFNTLVRASYDKKQAGSLYPKGEELGLNLGTLLKKNARQ